MILFSNFDVHGNFFFLKSNKYQDTTWHFKFLNYMSMILINLPLHDCHLLFVKKRIKRCLFCWVVFSYVCVNLWWRREKVFVELFSRHTNCELRFPKVGVLWSVSTHEKWILYNIALAKVNCACFFLFVHREFVCSILLFIEN